jgi:thiol-disulfide isomerase/thioredoxin
VSAQLPNREDPLTPEQPQTDGEGQAYPEPRLSRRAAWMAMGSVALALGLLWAASDLTDPRLEEPSTETGALSGSEDEPPDAVFTGKPAPLNFTIKDMNGVDVNLASFKGKVILLNFWATWCGPCKLEIPDLVELQRDYGDDLVVLGFSVDDTAEQIRPYAAEYKMNYPVLVGLGHENVQEAYGPLFGIPVSVLIDRQGRIAKKMSGIRSKEQFDREIQAVLGDRSSS